MAFDGPAYRLATDADVLSDGLQAIRPCSVRLSNWLVIVGTMRRVVVPWLADRASLALRIAPVMRLMPLAILKLINLSEIWGPLHTFASST